MKRIYVIVPKKLTNTTPHMKVNSGYAIAQAHHASVLAAKARNWGRYNLSHLYTVIVLQVPSSRVLVRVELALWAANVHHVIFRDKVSARKDQSAFTCIVTGALDHRPLALQKLKLWR